MKLQKKTVKNKSLKNNLEVNENTKATLQTRKKRRNNTQGPRQIHEEEMEMKKTKHFLDSL